VCQHFSLCGGEAAIVLVKVPEKEASSDHEEEREPDQRISSST